MRAVVLNTGTELLLGDVLNTHLVFIARAIFQFGLRVQEQRAIPDGSEIKDSLADFFSRAELVFVTGGLGPTTDDITREMVSEVLHLPLLENSAVRQAIRSRLERRGIPMPDRIWRQAMVPRGGDVLPNKNGTAPGIYLPANINRQIGSPHVFLLPGPPRELEPMFRDSVLTILQRLTVNSARVALRKFRMAGIGESIVEQKIGEQLLAIPGLEVGYCARPGEVELRVLGPEPVVAQAEKIIRSGFAKEIFSADDDDLAQVIVRLLSARGETLALAESCTGGFLGNRITNIAGASQAFLAGSIAYSNQEKIRALGVAKESLDQFGAVSAEVARAMAEGIRARAGTTHAISTTGIAGPGGGTNEKPVGTVFVALASEGQPTISTKYFFPNDRETFKQLVAQRAFDLLRKRLVAAALC